MGFSVTALPTSKLYISEVLRDSGVTCLQEIKFASREQLFMYLQCRHFRSLFGNQFGEKDFDLSLATSKISLYKIFDGLFYDGITLGRVTSMYVYGGLLALQLYKTYSFREMHSLVSDWIDEYISAYLKQRLVMQDRWKYYAPLFHLE